MHQLTVSGTTEWESLFLRIALEEYEKIQGVGAPFVLEPFLFFDGSSPGQYDEMYHHISRIGTLDRLVTLGTILPDDAVSLYEGTYEGSCFPLQSDHPLYHRHDHYHYTKIDITTIDPGDFLDLLCQDEIYEQIESDDGFRMVEFGVSSDPLDIVDKLNECLFISNMHLLTMTIPHEHAFICEWFAVNDIGVPFHHVCDGDGDVIAETYEVERFRKNGSMFEEIPCYVVAQHAYKGGGFACIN